jgi:hypothetical protein
MAKVSMSMNLGVPADKVWELIGGFNALPDWHPAVEKSEIEGEGTGSVRTLHLAGGGTIRERLEQVDDAGKVYSYSILSGPLPVMNYTATIRLREAEDGSGCAVEWESDFLPSGAPEGDAVEVIRGIYQAGFDNLKKMFGG